MPPIFTHPVSLGLNGSETSYCRSSPVPQQETYRKRSSSERFRSVTNGRTALTPLRIGGGWSGAAGWGGISKPLRFFPEPLPSPSSRCHSQIDDDRSLSEITTPTKP